MIKIFDLADRGCGKLGLKDLGRKKAFQQLVVVNTRQELKDSDTVKQCCEDEKKTPCFTWRFFMPRVG
jgi:hypothetical protein